MKYYFEDAAAVCKEVRSSENGLTADEAARRLASGKPNSLEAPPGKSLFRRFFEQIANPMIIILLCAAAVSAVLAVVEGESFADVIIILAVVLVNAVLGVYQEDKAEKAIEALQKMSAATSKVRRDGTARVVPSAELVPGDVVLLEAGDAVPADGRILECASMKIEESALTGESVPVLKTAGALEAEDGKADITLGDRKNMAYMGSTVVYGRGVLLVTDTGMNTEMGKIAGALTAAEDGETPLQKQLNQLSKTLTWLVLGICAVVFAVHMIRTGRMEFRTVINSLMVAVSLAVAAIPEGLAAVMTVVLSMGVTRMSKRNAIIRHMVAVETLGCTQIICSDKTGTLTQNKMTVVGHYGTDEAALAEAMALCCDSQMDEQGEVTGEPTENALVAWAGKLGKPKFRLNADCPRIAEAPFDSERKMMTTVHRRENNIVQYTKGAPDMVIPLCTSWLDNGKPLPMTDEKRAEIMRENKSMADRALRVLACACRFVSGTPDKDVSPAELEHDLCFMGLAGMIDPIRPEVKPAIDECRKAGIRPIMITGDHIDTASAIAKELGILEQGQTAVTGSQIGAMSDAEFEKVFRDISVYARVQPEHKTRIVKAWQNAGCVTAMTGDGVNDAPSIKTADIGIGMGITGTDVTKNVADMVLADDNFATIVGAVEEGRRIYDNIRKAIQFLLGSNISEVLCVFIASMLSFTILKPVHLLWVNLITDTFPALALGMEEAEKDIMSRKPRSSGDGIFAGGVGADILYQGILVTVLIMLSYLIGVRLDTGVWAFADSAQGMTMAFITMGCCEIFHSFNLRSRKHSIFRMHSQNRMLWISAVVSLILTVVVCEVPGIASVFGFVPVDFKEFLISIGLAFAVIPIVELVKLITGKCRGGA